MDEWVDEWMSEWVTDSGRYDRWCGTKAAEWVSGWVKEQSINQFEIN